MIIQLGKQKNTSEPLLHDLIIRSEKSLNVYFCFHQAEATYLKPGGILRTLRVAPLIIQLGKQKDTSELLQTDLQSCNIKLTVSHDWSGFAPQSIFEVRHASEIKLRLWANPQVTIPGSRFEPLPQVATPVSHVPALPGTLDLANRWDRSCLGAMARRSAPPSVCRVF